jgi:hypothetical protein
VRFIGVGIWANLVWGLGLCALTLEFGGWYLLLLRVQGAGYRVLGLNFGFRFIV